MSVVTDTGLPHLNGLEDMPTIHTPSFRKIGFVMKAVARQNLIAVVTGEPGLGKSFAVRYHTTEVAAKMTAERGDDPPMEIIWIQAAPKAAPKEVTHDLVVALTGKPLRVERYHLADEVVRHLNEQRRIVVVDEAQNLSRDGLDQLRHIHDVVEGGFPLILVGGPQCEAVLRRSPQLWDRVGQSIEVRPLELVEVLEIAPTYHPLLAATDKALLAEIDTRYARGVLRRWANVVQQAVTLCQETKTDRITPQLAKAILHTTRG